MKLIFVAYTIFTPSGLPPSLIVLPSELNLFSDKDIMIWPTTPIDYTLPNTTDRSFVPLIRSTLSSNIEFLRNDFSKSMFCIVAKKH